MDNATGKTGSSESADAPICMDEQCTNPFHVASREAASLPPLAPKRTETEQIDLLRAHWSGQHEAPEAFHTECLECENFRLGFELERVNAALVGRDKLLRKAFEAGDNAMLVIAADESWDRWAR